MHIFFQWLVGVIAAWRRFRQPVKRHLRRQAHGPRWSLHRPRRIGPYTRRRPRREG